jgi:hypothetical protein
MNPRNRVQRLEQKHRHEVQRRAMAEDAALLQMTNAELEAFVSFLRKNAQHLPSIELGAVSDLQAPPAWATPAELAAATRYEQLYAAAYRRQR